MLLGAQKVLHAPYMQVSGLEDYPITPKALGGLAHMYLVERW